MGADQVDYAGAILEIIRLVAGGLTVKAGRWIVERTIACIECHRRIGRHLEEHAATTDAWMYLAMVRLMLRRLWSPPEAKPHAAI